MKAPAFVLTVAVVLLSALSSLSLHAQQEDKPFDDKLGKLALGQKAAEAAEVLGKPERKGKDEFWEATGEWVQEWNYPKQGLSVRMAAGKQSAPRTVLMITAKAGCTLATSRGIKIGSTEAEVRKAYKEVENREEGEPGKTFVAGSIYGGVIFTLAKGKVVEIFIGAAAE